MSTRLRAVTRTASVSGPCTVMDIGGGGLRVDNDAGLPIAPGDSLVLSLEGGGDALRIDLPGRVRYVDSSGDWFGVEFAGAPLMMHQRRASQTPTRSTSTAGTAEVPIARALPKPEDFAA